MSMSAWTEAKQRARTIAPATAWRAGLARAVRRATGARFVAVFTCPPGAPLAAQVSVTPPSAQELVRRIQTRFLPQIERTPDGIRLAERLPSRAYAPLLATAHRELAHALRHEVLHPARVCGLINVFIPGPAGARGWICVGTPSPEAAALRRYRAALSAVSRAAARTLDHALELAATCGATAPAAALPACLSPRERQVATLVALGLKDLNVAARLSISEETVGTHLRVIYRKLRVSSRLDLRERLFGGLQREALFE